CKAETPSEAQFALCIRASTVRTGKCEYAGGNKIILDRIDWKAELRDLSTAKVVAARTFRGETTTCPFQMEIWERGYNDSAGGFVPDDPNWKTRPHTQENTGWSPAVTELAQWLARRVPCKTMRSREAH